MEDKYYLNIYDNTTGNAWQEVFEEYDKFYKRFIKIKHSKKLWALSHSGLD
jgi:hypothetical protein